MATLDEEASGECGSDAEEVVEEHKEYIENPDGSYTVKTIKTIVTMVEEEEEEEEAGEGGEKEEGEEDKFGVDGLGQLTEEELNEFMMLQAERKWLDKMAPGGAREEEEEETLAVVEEETTTKKKKKRPDGEKKGKKKKKRGDGKENKKRGSSSSYASDDSFDEASDLDASDGAFRTKSVITKRETRTEVTIANGVQHETSTITTNQINGDSQQLKNGFGEMGHANLQNGNTKDTDDEFSNKAAEDEGIELKEGDVSDISEIVSVEGDGGCSSLSHLSAVERLRAEESLSSLESPTNSTGGDGVEGLQDTVEDADDHTDLVSPDEDLSEYMAEDSTLIVGNHLDQEDVAMTEEQKEWERAREQEEDELYSIDVKKLADSFLSSPGADDAPRPNTVDDLPEQLPNIAHLVETYKKSPTKASDSTQPSDIPSGLSLRSMKSAYEASTGSVSPRKEGHSALEEEGLTLNFSQMRAAYCSVVNQSAPATTPHVSTNSSAGPNIRDLRASYGDLTVLEGDPAGGQERALSGLQEPTQVSSDCRACGKQVFQMEKIVAEKASWHKNCFRCSECSKNLTLETYQSHEGVLYCKPHFKELFRPKAVVEDPVEARKERLLRRPKMIVLESNPEILPDDVVRATSKPDYGLEELSTLNMKQRFSMFEAAGQEDEEPKLEPVSVRRSQSMISRAARFLAENGEKEHGVDNSELGEYEDDEEEEEGLEEEEEEEETEEEIEEEDGVDEDGEPIIVKTTRKIKKKKTRPTSFNNASDMKEMFEKQSRRDEMTKMRKEELGRFRQMLCAGKNISLKEKFESGQFENEEKDKNHNKEEIKIDQKRAARSLKAKFEQGQPFIMDEDGENEHSRKNVGERQEVEEVFKEAETASHARNLFRQIDSKVNQDGSAALMRSQSFATVGSKENRRSMDVGNTPYTPPPTSGDVVKCHDPTDEDPHVDSQDLASKFMFFATFENRQKEDAEKKRKVFRMTPPREGADQGLVTEDVELGRDPNLIKCTDNYQDDVDCRNTKSILNMFRKMEAKNVMGVEDEDDDESEGEGEYDEEEYSDEEEYTDEEYSGEEEEEEDDEEGAEERGKAPYKDELLQMSAKKAAQLRAKFEKWEAEVDRNNDINKVNGGRGEDDEEAMPSLDTARNLKAMFEEKAQEAAKPQIRERAKVNRFVGGGGDKCPACGKTVYAMEKFEVQGKIIHKTCFKCCKCLSPLSMVTFTMGGGKLYCNSHYKQLFTEKGNYDAILSGSGAAPSTAQ